MFDERGRITSRHNPIAKYVRSLSQRKNRDLTGCFLVEGIRLLEEAREASVKGGSRYVLEMVLFSPDALPSGRLNGFLYSLPEKVEIVPVSTSVMEFISDTSSSPGVMGVVRGPADPVEVEVGFLDNAPQGRLGRFVLILDTIRDPGNLGTLLRTAEAAGVSEVWMTAGTVDCFSPKVVRATMGSIFRVPVRTNVKPSQIAARLSNGVNVYGTARGRGKPFFATDFAGPLAVVLGSEAEGLGPQLETCVTEWVHIPMAGEVESLNVAVAGALVLFEIARQHRLLEHDFRVVL